MMTSAFRFLAPLACIACLSLAIPSTARAATDGINRLILVSQLKAENANEEALNGAEKQRGLVKKQQQLRNAQAAFEAVAAPTNDGILDAIGAVAEFEAVASVDGLDDAEVKRLAELVGVAQQRVDAAIKNASSAIASTKKLTKETTAADEQAAHKLHLKSLRATVKAHRQTSAALKTLAKRLSA